MYQASTPPARNNITTGYVERLVEVSFHTIAILSVTDDKRPVMRDVNATNLRSSKSIFSFLVICDSSSKELSGLGLFVIDAPFLDKLSKIPTGNGGYGDAFRVSVNEDKVKNDGSASKKVDVCMIHLLHDSLLTYGQVVIKTYKENGLEIANVKVLSIFLL